MFCSLYPLTQFGHWIERLAYVSLKFSERKQSSQESSIGSFFSLNTGKRYEQGVSVTYHRQQLQAKPRGYVIKRQNRGINRTTQGAKVICRDFSQSLIRLKAPSRLMPSLLLNCVYKAIHRSLPSFLDKAITFSFLDVLRLLFVLSTMFLVNNSSCFLGIYTHAQFLCISLSHLVEVVFCLEVGYRSVEGEFYKLPGRHPYVPYGHIIFCSPVKVLCQMTEVIVVMTFVLVQAFCGTLIMFW